MAGSKSPKTVSAEGRNSQFWLVPGSVKGTLPGAYIVGRPNPARHIEVTVLVRPRPHAAGAHSLHLRSWERSFHISGIT